MVVLLRYLLFCTSNKIKIISNESYLRVVSIFALVVEHIEERVFTTTLPATEEVASADDGRHELRIAQRRDGGVPGVHRVHYRPLPVRILVHHCHKDLRQVVLVRVPHIGPYDPVASSAVEARLEVCRRELAQGLTRHHAEEDVQLSDRWSVVCAVVRANDDAVDAGAESVEEGGGCEVGVEDVLHWHFLQASCDVYVTATVDLVCQ